MSKQIFFLAFLPLAALAQPVQTGSASTAAPLSAPARVGVGAAQEKLTLREAIELALKQNLEIEIERTNVANAAAALRAAKGVFDPNFRYQPGIETRNSPTASVLQGAGGKLAEHGLTQNFYFRQKTPWYGSAFNVDFENGRSSTSNSFSSLNPLRTSRLLIGFNQPLWRNRGIDRERGEISIRRKQIEISDLDFELRVIDVINRVEQSYWNLVAARQDAVVQEEGVRLAREQLERNQRMIAAGTLAPVELAASEAELQRRMDSWYTALGLVTEVENALKTLLAPDRSAAIWNAEIIPAEFKTSAPPEASDLKAMVALAMKKRRELRQVGLRLEANGIQKSLNENQTKPQMNLVASYWNSGLGGSLRPGDNPLTASNAALYQRVDILSTAAGLPHIVPPSFGDIPDYLVGGYGTALKNVFSGRYQSAQVGISFDLTLRNQTAKANLAQSAIAEKRLKLDSARLEQAIEAQVRNALQSLETAKQRIVATSAGEKAAQEKLGSEIRLFQTGESTNFLVLTRQNEFLEARRRGVVATLEFNRSVARIEQAAGATLEWYNITLK